MTGTSRLALVFALAALALLYGGAAPGPATAGTILTVNTTDAAADGACDAHCSLADALAAAGGGDTVAFDIPPSDPGYDAGLGVWTIHPPSPFTVREGLTVDGTTQAANQGDTNPLGPEVEVDGSSHEAAYNCFRLRSESVLRGLVVNRCGSYGVWVEGSGIRVAGNYIGTDPTGTEDAGAALDGVLVIRAQDNIIGGAAPGDRNIISGNRTGVRISDATSEGNQIAGNYIGTDRAGGAALGNEFYGVNIHAGAHDNEVGPGNVISGNLWGLYFSEGPSDNTVHDNYVGSDASGAAPLPNTGLGVMLSGGAAGNTIGPGNVVAYNARDGVWVEGADVLGNTVTRNSIFANGTVNHLGINNLSGGNLELAAPSIASASPPVGTACAGCTVELFSDGEDEGRVYEGTATADGTGNWTLNPSVSGPNLTATATDAAGNTSEFSAPFALPAAPYIWGDADCNNSLAIGDAQKIARKLIDLAITQTPPCFELGADVTVDGAPRRWADADCNGALAIGDAQKIARKLIDLAVTQEAGCPRIGDTVAVLS
ncbi:MAG: hypothetical protein Q7T33_04125 [Dehalococcoidia bacterium]|nr:hypothetical protein [Dehalococcoidia bacterium]